MNDDTTSSTALPLGLLARLVSRPVIVALAIFGAVVLLVTGAALFDTRKVRATEAELRRFSTGSLFGSNRDDESADEARAIRCFDMLQSSPDGKSTIRTSEWRECVMNAAPFTKTLAGGLAIATMAAPWLKQHPQDAEFKAALLNALEVARTDLKHSEPWFDAVQQNTFAKRDSVVSRIKDPLYYSGFHFGDMAERINKLDYQIQAPEVYYKQMAFLNQPATPQPKADAAHGPALASR